ncbi:MAG: amidohydrolase [Pirellulaceae bacterium]
MKWDSLVQEIDDELSHVWMVRTFLKHSDEAEEDDDVNEIHRQLYDYAHALGPALESKDWIKYLRLAKKKLKKLLEANALFQEVQPEISSHTNFQMACRSLNLAVIRIASLVEQYELADLKNL